MSDQPNEVFLQDRLMQLANLEANELAEVMQQAADRIEELENELMEQCRINGMGAERELAKIARIEADEALMRQALEALQRLDGWLADRHLGGLMPDEKAILAALLKRLESST